MAGSREAAVEMCFQKQLSMAGEGEEAADTAAVVRVDGGAWLPVRTTIPRTFSAMYIVPLFARKSRVTNHGSRGQMYVHRYGTFPLGGGSAYYLV